MVPDNFPLSHAFSRSDQVSYRNFSFYSFFKFEFCLTNPDLIFFNCTFSIVDAFFLDGACVIFRIALAILRENEQKIIECRDEGEVMLQLSGFMESVYSREAPQSKSQQSAPRDVLNARAGTGPEITALIR